MDHFQTHLKRLDVSLACGICSDVFDTPLLIRTCGHSFCAACIRQSIEFQEKKGTMAYCPTCRVGCDARDLVGNVALRGVVEKYLNLLEWCKVQEEEQAKQREEEHAKHAREAAQQKTIKHRIDTHDKLCVISVEGSEDVYSSGEEYDPKKEAGMSLSHPRKKNKMTMDGRGGGHTAIKGEQSCPPAIGTSSFLECPVCGKNVHRLHMNGHIDACLVAKPQEKKPAWKPLEVPSKIIGTLANDKTIKNALRKYGLPCEGKKPELIDRYNRFRTEVEIANDKQEVTTYEKIVFRIAKQESYKAAASLFKYKKNETSSLNTSMMRSTKKEIKMIDKDGVIDMTLQSSPAKHPSEIVLPDDPSYTDLIRITKRRDRLRKQLLVLAENQTISP